jgi:hypothetical protein
LRNLERLFDTWGKGCRGGAEGLFGERAACILFFRDGTMQKPEEAPRQDSVPESPPSFGMWEPPEEPLAGQKGANTCVVTRESWAAIATEDAPYGVELGPGFDPIGRGEVSNSKDAGLIQWSLPYQSLSKYGE